MNPVDLRRVRLGLLTNPVALHNHRFPATHQQALKQLRSTADAAATVCLSDVDPAIRHLLLEQEVNVLAINGGDGTIHGAVNAVIRVLGPRVAAGTASFPALLLLNGGTYNMASRAFGTKADPVGTIERFQQRFRDRPFAEVPTRTLPLLQVEREGREPMAGTVFGSQVVAQALELCDRLGSGYLGLARLLAQGTMSALFKTDFFRDNAWRLRASNPVSELDGVAYEGVSAIVAATIDMKLARGTIWALTTSGRTRGFHAKLILAKRPTEIVRLLPNLLWELPHPMVLSFPEATSAATTGSFTLDGELHDHSGPLRIRLCPFRFEVVPGDEL